MKKIALVILGASILLNVNAEDSYNTETPKLDKPEYRFTYINYAPSCSVSPIGIGGHYVSHREKSNLACKGIARKRAESTGSPLLFADEAIHKGNAGALLMFHTADTRFLKDNPTHLIVNIQSLCSKSEKNISALIDKLHKARIKTLIYSYFFPIPESIKNHPGVEILEDGSGSFRTLTDRKGRTIKAQLLYADQSHFKMKRLSDGRAFRVKFNWLSPETYDRLFNPMKDPILIAEIEASKRGLPIIPYQL